MPSIEQMPNGTYVKQLNNTEKNIINRLYQEIQERTDEAEILRGRIVALEEQLVVVLAELDNMKARISELEVRVNTGPSVP